MSPIQHLDSHRGAFRFSAVGLYEVNKKLSYVLLATETISYMFALFRIFSALYLTVRQV